MKIIVAPLHEVDDALTAWRPSHVIGLASPGAEIASIPPPLRHLQLRFHDIVEPRDELCLVTEDDVERLLAFAAEWPRTAPLLIQCWAGVGRSPAAAYAIACMISGPGHEDRLADELRRRAPFATPNRRVVALADRQLDRQGAMVAAINRIGRGAETSTGAVFVVDV